MKKINLLMFGAALISLTSCLKDGKVNLAPGASPAVVEFSTAVVGLVPAAITATSPAPLYIQSFEALPAVTQVFQVGYTGGEPSKTDITVNIGVNYAMLSAFNVANFGDSTATTPVANQGALNKAKYYTGLPASLWKVTTPVVIKAGESKAGVTLTINTALFDFSKKYALPLTITSVSGTSAPISGNYGTIIFAPTAKNKYDGIYTVTGTFNDNTSAAFVGQYPITQDLRTQTATTVSEYDGRYATANYAHPFLNGTQQTSYGGWAPSFEMSAADVVVSVTNHFGQGNNNRQARLDAGGINKWTFASGKPVKMEVTYWLVQGPVYADRTKFTEVWTYVSPRP